MFSFDLLDYSESVVAGRRMEKFGLQAEQVLDWATFFHPKIRPLRFVMVRER